LNPYLRGLKIFCSR